MVSSQLMFFKVDSNSLFLSYLAYILEVFFII